MTAKNNADWRILALTGDYQTILYHKLLPYDVFKSLGQEIWYADWEAAGELGLDHSGWVLTARGMVMLQNIAIQRMTPELEKQLIETIKQKQEHDEEFRQRALIVKKINEILKELDEIRRTQAELIPEKDYTPEGEKIKDPTCSPIVYAYGGGQWWVIEKHKNRILFIINNGGDGDDWSINNVRTGGAGAVGSYVPYSPELEAKLMELKALGEKLGNLVTGEFEYLESYNTMYKPRIESPAG